MPVKTRVGRKTVDRILRDASARTERAWPVTTGSLRRLDFFIPGRPRATQTGSIVRAGGRAFPTRRNTPWSAYCGLVAKQHAPALPFTEALAVDLTFLLPAPKKWKGGTRPAKRPDIDGLCKGLLDAWNGILYRDDAQVVELTLEKRYGLTLNGVRVVVRETI